MTEEKKEEEALPDWLQETLVEAAEKREEAPSMTPPPVSTAENTYINISSEERERKFRRGNYLILAVIIIQIIALAFVILW